MFLFSILSCLPEIYVSLYTVPCKNCWNFYSLIFLMRLCYFHKDIGLVVFRYLKFSILIFSPQDIVVYIRRFSVLHLYIKFFFPLIELGVHFFLLYTLSLLFKRYFYFISLKFCSPCSIFQFTLCCFYMYVNE